MPELPPDLFNGLADLIPQIMREWEAMDLAGITANFQQLLESAEEMMDGWVTIGECYVKPIDWDELWLIEPQGVVYAAYRHHLTNDQRIAVGTGPTPARAARLLTEAVRAAAGEVDQEESRRNHGLLPRDGAARLREADRRVARSEARSELLARAARAAGEPDAICAPYNTVGGGAGLAQAFNVGGMTIEGRVESAARPSSSIQLPAIDPTPGDPF